MKKIKVRPEGKTVLAKEFKPIDYFSQNKSKIINLIIVFVVTIFFISAVFIWRENKKLNAPVLLVQAENLFSEGKYDASLNIYEQFVKQFPKHKLTPAALLGAAYSYEQLKKFNDAKETFLKIEKQFPNSPWRDEAVKGVERLS